MTFLVFIAILFMCASSANAASRTMEVDVCTNLKFTRPIDPELSSEEKRLACGKGSRESEIYPEWQNPSEDH